MALAFQFTPRSMTAAQYDDCILRLKKAGANHPPGRVYHACVGGPDTISVFDVWTSQAAFDAFGKTLMPILQAIGADPGQPSVTNVHNVIVPPAAKPQAKAKKPAPKKRAAPRKAKARKSSKRR